MPDDLDSRLPAALDYKSRDRDVANLTRYRVALRILKDSDPEGPIELKAVTVLSTRLGGLIAMLERKLKEG